MIYFLPLLAVFLGYLIALFIKPGSSIGFKLLLAFSGAYLLSVTVFELLPEVYETGDNKVGIFIMIGLLLQIILEFGSKGVEHGHIHHEGNKGAFPFALLISLCIHAFLEGFPLNTSEHLLHGVVIHKIPVAAILSTFLLQSGISKAKVFLFLGLFALMTPLGSWIQLNNGSITQYSAYIHAIVIGIFLHVSTTILFEASKNHKFNASKLAVIIFGILLAYFL
ncbi:ZIP family metal transporter [Antarcticibacterium flavum]|uniref:ZIP family metal transporter n=1 Tax=Antarcticibacterium flavum TaxID=2058175 RepID=A0A5B7WZE2_9FLAO|nr:MULTISPECIES: ZIP family metal transporter [Antarcticibacterium]MCM4161886.1 ZIP family metal transporter [Antarcticibacterium sp. W02-3]QCY68345.1 ZIP family metal transporter [Antarcticibacterium flavum]